MGGRSITVASNPPYEQKFIWDKEKNDRCANERGFDFNFAARIWQDPRRREFSSPRAHAPEPRNIMYGRIDGKLYAAVTTPQGEYLRIFSARRVSKRWEIDLYELGYSRNR